MVRQYYYHLNGDMAYYVPWSYVFNCVCNRGPRRRKGHSPLKYPLWRSYYEARRWPRLFVLAGAATPGGQDE
jgi:hypothetical protein